MCLCVCVYYNTIEEIVWNMVVDKSIVSGKVFAEFLSIVFCFVVNCFRHPVEHNRNISHNFHEE